MATGRPSACSFEGRHTRRSPDLRTNDENTVPTTANRRSTRARATWRAPAFKLLAWREDLRRPWSPASTPRFDIPPEQRSWNWNTALVASPCAKLELKHTTGCKSMREAGAGTHHWLQVNARSWSWNIPLVASQCVAPGWPAGLRLTA